MEEVKEFSEKNNPVDGMITYDFETDRPFLMYVSSFRLFKDTKTKYILSKIYGYSIIIFFSFLVIMGFIASLIIQDRKLKLEAVHWTFLLLVGLAFMIIRITNGLEDPLKAIREEFFIYSDERLKEEYLKIRAYRVRRVWIVSNFFLMLAITSGVFLSFIKQVNKTSKSGEQPHKSINTGLPIPVFLPFDTTTVTGFICGYLIDIIAFFYLVVITSSTQQIFLSIMEQLIAQFEILNMSISNVHKRAYTSHTNGKQLDEITSLDKLYTTSEFQKCLTKCLMQNVCHHQVLLRFKNNIKRFNESIFLFLVLSSIIILAAIMFVILELQEISEATILLWLLSTEIVYVFVICYYGEILSQESGKVFFTLWDAPWWNFNNNNKIIVHIMLSMTMNPIVMGAPGFSSNMSLETFGDILARAYQFMSVVRKMK